MKCDIMESKEVFMRKLIGALGEKFLRFVAGKTSSKTKGPHQEFDNAEGASRHEDPARKNLRKDHIIKR